MEESACVQPRLSTVWHTGLSGALGWALANWPLWGIRQRRTAIIHRTIRWYTGLSGEPMAAGAMVGRAIRARRVAHANGRLGAPDCPVRQPAQRSNGRLRQEWKEICTGHEQWMSGGAPDCPVRHPTEGKNCLPRLPSTSPCCLGAIKGPIGAWRRHPCIP